MPRDTSSKVYEFSGFRLEGTQRRLLYQGQPVPLTGKILDLLLFLVEKRGQLVTKEELLKQIWPDAVVEENNITVSMSILRKTLGEDRLSPRFIETVPRQGYRFIADVTEVLPQRITILDAGQNSYGSAAQDGPIDSLAVLPVQSNDNDQNVDYLSDGITESIINILSRIPNLRVLACSTVFRFKAKEIDAISIGVLLNVKAVMMIRVILLGETLVIRGQLVKVADGSQLWGEQYNRSHADILAVQDEIAKAISESLELRLTRQDQLRLVKHSTKNTGAYNLYLRGRYFWNKYNKESVLKAIDLFKEAIAIDENYALAYCGMADAYFRLSNVYFPPREVLPKAKESALRALAIDDDLAEAHSSLGLICVYYDHDWTGAEREYRRALELNPTLVSAHQRYGSYLTYMGRFDESIKRYQIALELDPFSLQINTNLATTYCFNGECGKAVDVLNKTIELEPNYIPTRFVLGWVRIQEGRLAEAIEEYQSICKLDDEAYLSMGFMGYAHALAGERAEAEALLNTLQDISLSKYVSPYSMLLIHLALGPKERVFELLEQLYEECNDWLVWLQISPELKVLRDEPRFKDLLRRVGFPD
jgi:DNA-binding winged helix-turn-helix (wHTH) protein/tetratricopeptide (TPR) repeat protein